MSFVEIFRRATSFLRSLGPILGLLALTFTFSQPSFSAPTLRVVQFAGAPAYRALTDADHAANNASDAAEKLADFGNTDEEVSESETDDSDPLLLSQFVPTPPAHSPLVFWDRHIILTPYSPAEPTRPPRA
jgi:hypothetical protein